MLLSSPRKESVSKPLGYAALVAIIFYEVSGGPFGVEDAVKAGGPLLTILGFIVFPLVWSVPEALLTAELATAFPENSGYVAWVTAAFGPSWGFFEGYLSWISGVIDNSIYPVYFAETLAYYVAALNVKLYKMIFVFVTNFVLTYINYRGLNVVGNLSVAFTVVLLAPFAVLVGVGLPKVQPRLLAQVEWKKVNVKEYLNFMFWNLNYWDSASTLAGEVRDPKRTFPRALAGALALVVAAYLLPVVVGLGSGATSAAAWGNGYFVVVAQRLVGEWLGVWVVVATAISNLGLFMAEMSSDSYQLHGMAERGMIPKVFATKSRHGTPTYGILASCLGVLLVAWADFERIVEMLNLAYCFASLLEFAAFLRLRWARPDLERPFVVPLNSWGCVAMLAPAAVLIVAVILVPFYERDVWTLAFLLGVGALGWPLLRAMRWLRVTGRVEFAEGPTGGEHAGKGGGLLPVCSLAPSLGESELGGVDLEEVGSEHFPLVPSPCTPFVSVRSR